MLCHEADLDVAETTSKKADWEWDASAKIWNKLLRQLFFFRAINIFCQNWAKVSRKSGAWKILLWPKRGTRETPRGHK